MFYGSVKYGETVYGLSDLPTSAEWEVYDFCSPIHSVMTSLFSFAEVSPLRTYGLPNMYYNAEYDLVCRSDDELPSGFTIDIGISSNFSFQFSILPTALPVDFSSTDTNRVFVATRDRYGKMVGLLLSEAGIALAQEGDASYQILPDSADLFEQGTDYYVFRVAVDSAQSRANLYVTRKDLLPTIGHQLRYTIELLDSPSYLTDGTVFEVYGTAAEPTEVALDCWRLSAFTRIPNRRPVAVPGPDQTVVLGGYGGFDGRDSYDPEGAVPLQFWWTATDILEESEAYVSGTGTTAAHSSGYTDRVNVTAEDIANVQIGDLLWVNGVGSVIKYIGVDHLITISSVFMAGFSVEWTVLHQYGWGGARVSGVVTEVVDYTPTPPVSPTDGHIYLVGDGATGMWTGEDERYAQWNGTAWIFSDPAADDIVYSVVDSLNYRYIGGNYPAGQWEFSDPQPWELDHWTGRTAHIGSYLSDVAGLITCELLVNDGEVTSLPAEVLLNVGETSAALGVVPDVGWIWNYLPDFWSLVADKGKIETAWGGFAQIASGLLLELWQHDYAKSLLDVQRLFQKRWLHYALYYEEPNYKTFPPTFYTGLNLGGFAATPGTEEYTYDTGTTLPATVTNNHLLILGGTCYRIVRVSGTVVITKDPLPTTDRPQNWLIRSTLHSYASQLEQERVGFGDLAVFDVVSSTGDSVEIEAFVYGSRRNILAFDDTELSGYLASPNQTVYFLGVRRRGALKVNEYVVGIPRLQMYIDLALDSTGTLFHQSLDFYLDDEDVEGTTVRTLRFRDGWVTRLATGFDGEVTNPRYLDSMDQDFETIFGAGADLSEYVLEIDGVRHRLYQVVSATRLELEEDCLESGVGVTWTVYRLEHPSDRMWAEVTYVDNRPTIEANFGRLVGLSVDDVEGIGGEVDYLSAVQGLWYAFWHGPSPANLRIGAQILLGLPFSEVKGEIVGLEPSFDSERGRILIRDDASRSVIRSYFYPKELELETNPETGTAYKLEDTVEQFAPLVRGVEVTDWVEDTEWFRSYLESGDFLELWKFHTFGVIVDAEVFSLDNLQLVMDFVHKIRARRTYPFFVVDKNVSDNIDVQDYIMLGPVTLDGPELSEDWPPYQTPVYWPDSPWESRVTRITAPIYSITDRWPTNRYLGDQSVQRRFGNLHLYDSPGRIPDGWQDSYPRGAGTHDATRAEGAHIWNDFDPSGRDIHIFGVETYATSVATDGDMEAVGVADWPDIVGAAPTTKAKSAVTFYEGAQSLELADVQASRGCYQEFPSTIEEGFQAAVRCWAFVTSGQGIVQLIDQDGTTVLAQKRFGVTLNWQQFTLHTWAVGSPTVPLQVRFITGPAGGHFFVDAVELYAKAVPWDQWGLSSAFLGRTGGYTIGGCPDEKIYFQVAASVP